MPLPLPPNCLIDVYRGFNKAQPMPANGTLPVLAGVPAYLKHHMKNGRFGNTGALLHWTHKLFLDFRDVRDAYNEEMVAGPAEVVANADTVVVHDYLHPGQCCPFFVNAVVRRHNRALGDFLNVYLDSAQPGLCPSLPVVSSACCPNLLPQNLLATVIGNTNAPCLQGVQVLLVYDGQNKYWSGQTPVPGCIVGGVLSLILQCHPELFGNTCRSFILTGSCGVSAGDGIMGAASPLSCQCYPPGWTFAPSIAGGPQSCCPFGGGITVNITA